MEIPIKVEVQCADGPGGQATHVIVHPATKKVTRVVVKEAKSPHVERIVPFKFVAEAPVNQIRLRCSRQDLSRMQVFVRTEHVETAWSYVGPTPTGISKVKRLNISEDELSVDSDTRVRATDGKAGRIDELVVDSSNGSITHLVLREGPVWAPRAVTVPIADVERMDEKTVYLRTNRAAIEALPASPVVRR
jgi:sporulation protein YlmC with PRC-barrel domain